MQNRLLNGFNTKGQIFSIILAILLLTTTINAQWQQVNLGPVGGGQINSVAVFDSDVFAGTRSGIIRSTDNGTDWTTINSSFTLCFTSIGSNIFAGTSSGIILSTDNGNSWTNPNSNMSYNITALVINNSNIFAGTDQYGIFRSTNNGNSWTATNNGLGDNEVHALAVIGTTIYAGTAAGLYISTDNGNSWSTVVANNLTSLQVINCITGKGSDIFVGTPGGILRSIDNGNTWEKSETGINGPSIFSIIEDSSNTFAGTTSGVYMSTDNGGNWTAENNGLPVSPSQVYSVAECPNGSGGTNLYAGTNNGVYLSTNNGKSWTTENKGNVGTQLDCIAGNGSNIFAVMLASPQSKFVSNDYGATWNATADSGLIGFINNFTFTGSGLYAVTNSGIFLSSNDGENWSSISGGVMDTVYPLALVKSGSNLIVSTQNKGIYFSSNNGASWEYANGNIPRYPDCLAAFGSDVFSGGNGGIYLSTNSGENWTILNDTLTDVISIVSIGSTLFASRAAETPEFFGDTIHPHPGSLFRSSDNGKTWAQITSLLPDSLYLPFLDVHDTDIFMWDNNSMKTLYVSKNNGESWTYLGNGLPDEEIIGLFVNDSSVFAGVGINYGIWQLPLSDIITAVKQPTLQSSPKSFILLQNYPNPFNPSTIISYSVPKSSLVTIQVYDILGREVETLVNENKSAGNYSVQFNASSGFSSGVYFYRMQAGSFVETKKLILMK